MKYTVDYALFTNIGGRDVNEDSIKATETGRGYCFVLCDGLGGHGMGDAASQTVVEALTDVIIKNDGKASSVGEAYEASQAVLVSRQEELHARGKMKTTATMAIIDKRKVFISHVGDSRVYAFKDNKVLGRTQDHSVPQMLVLSGEIKESEIRNHPDRNLVLRVMGDEWREKQYDCMKPVSLRKCQAILMCTDGFWELIEECEMERLLRETKTAREWVDAMAKVVAENGRGKNMDNNSAIAVRINKG